MTGWAGWVLYRIVRLGGEDLWKIPFGAAVLMCFFFPLVLRTFYDHHVLFLVMGSQIILTFFLQQGTLLSPLRRLVLCLLSIAPLLLFMFPYVLFTTTGIFDLRHVDPVRIAEGIRGVHGGMLLLALALELWLSTLKRADDSRLSLLSVEVPHL
jgi:hypothetical protein